MLRKANENDINSLMEIERACFEDPWTIGNFIDELKNENATYYILTIDNKDVGYIGYWEIVGELHITNIALMKECRGKDYANMLVEQLIKLNMNITLEVRVSNIRAIKFYEKHNFIKEGLRKNYYKNPTEDAVLMWRYNEGAKYERT